MALGLSRFKQPAYTGENRCYPCTIANIAIAGLASIVIGVGTPIGGAVVFGLSLVVIYLRGYLIPGTPQLTQQYFPASLLALFGKTPAEEQPIATADLDVEQALVELGVVEPCPDRDDLCLVSAFQTAWYDEIAHTATTPTDVSFFRGLDIEHDAVTFRHTAGTYNAYVDGRRISQWESAAACRADLAADRVFRTRIRGWDELPFERRFGLVSALRLWLDQCPDCGGAVTLSDETVTSCCQSYEVIAGRCEECGTRVFEAQVSPEQLPSQ